MTAPRLSLWIVLVAMALALSALVMQVLVLTEGARCDDVACPCERSADTRASPEGGEATAEVPLCEPTLPLT